MARPFYRGELVGTDLIWLLSIEYAGRTFRFSSEPVNVTHDDGTYVHRGHLPPLAVQEAARAFSNEPEMLSASFDLLFPINVAAFEARGHDLSSATGELALLLRGGTWETRRVLFSGAVVQPEYGAEGEPVAFSLEEQPWDDRGVTHDPSARLTPQTWADGSGGFRGAHAGRYYPLVYGTPGKYTAADGTASTTSGSSTMILTRSGTDSEDADKILIAGHQVNATTVRVFNDKGNNDLAVTTETDLLGRTVSTVDVTSIGSSGSDRRKTQEFYVGWNDASGGGMPNPWGPGELSGAGDVLLWLLSMSSLSVDFGRIVAHRAWLNRFRLAGVIDQAASPWSYIEDHLLDILPVSVRSGPGGLYVLVWRLDASAADAVETLTEGAGVARLGPVSRDRGRRDVANEFRLDWAVSDKWDAPRRSSTLLADPDTSDTEQQASLYSKVSTSRYGQAVESLSSTVIFDTATAGLVMAWKLRASGFLHRSIRYEVSSEYGHLEPGAVVTLTSADLHLTSQVCLVREIGWSDTGTLELDLWIVEDPARDTRESAA
ncbi:MAG TPA: hypothetical protein QGF58_21460 [Myxococcota bacterium]|nr:hypothetical protein [Myxococcota bacterium]